MKVIYILSYDPPDLIIRKVYGKTSRGFTKMKSIKTIKLEY